MLISPEDVKVARCGTTRTGVEFAYQLVLQYVLKETQNDEVELAEES